MNCEYVRKNLGAFTDAELPAEATEQIKAHVEKCQDCHRALKRLQVLTGILDEVLIPAVPENLTGRLMAFANERCRSTHAMQHKHQSVFRMWNSRVFTVQRVAAAIVFVMGLAVGALMGRGTWHSTMIQSKGKLPMLQAETVDTYNFDYLTEIPKGSLADAYLTFTFETDGR